MRSRSESTSLFLLSLIPLPSLSFPLSFPLPRLLSFTISSSVSSFPSPSSSSLSYSSAPNTSDEPRSLAVERTREWCVDTDHKLSILAHKMTASLVMSEGWRVRVGMVVWAHSLLTHCHR